MRLTLDWDNIDFTELIARLKILRTHYQGNRIIVEQSANRRGYHAIISGACNTFEEQLKLRDKFWDDKKRVIIDGQRWEKGIPIGILFTQKGGKHVRKY